MARVYLQTYINGVTRRCCVVAWHVTDRENGGRTMHFGGQCSFPGVFKTRNGEMAKWQNGEMVLKIRAKVIRYSDFGKINVSY